MPFKFLEGSSYGYYLFRIQVNTTLAVPKLCLIYCKVFLNLFSVYDSWDNNLEDCKEVCSFPSNLHLDDVEKNLNRQILTAQHFSWLHENSDIVDDDQCLILNGVYQNGMFYYIIIAS